MNLATHTSGVPTRRSPTHLSRERCGAITPGQSTGQDFKVHHRGICFEVQTQPTRLVWLQPEKHWYVWTVQNDKNWCLLNARKLHGRRNTLFCQHTETYDTIYWGFHENQSSPKGSRSLYGCFIPLALNGHQRHREADSLQEQVMETGSARTQTDPIGFTETEGLRHTTMRYLLHTEPSLLLWEAIYNPSYKRKRLIWKLFVCFAHMKKQFLSLNKAIGKFLSRSWCLWQTTSAMSTLRRESSCRKSVTRFLMLWTWLRWFSSDVQSQCSSGSAELSLVVS